MNRVKHLLSVTGLGLSIAAITSCMSTSYSTEEDNLPVVRPAFKPEKLKAIKPKLEVLQTSRGENPVLIAGNKRIAVREQNAWHQRITYNFKRPSFFTIIINNRQALKAYFVGHDVKEKNYGHPFNEKNKGKLTYNTNNQSITFTKQYTYTPGKTATYSHTLQTMPDGKIKVSWDLGLDAATLKSFQKDHFWFVPQLYLDSRYLKTGIAYNGQSVKFLSKAEFKKTEAPKAKPIAITSGTGGTITCAPKNPSDGFKLIFNKDDNVKILEGYGKYQSGKHLLKVSIGNKIKSATGFYLIDLGKVATQSSDTPPPVRSTDNWQSDRSHIPLPATRNIMPNPSFEQGKRYWRSYSLGGNFRKEQDHSEPLYEISDDAKFGNNSLKINSSIIPLNTFSIPVEKGKTYTISYYAKSLNPKGTSIQFTAGSSIQTGDWLKWKTSNQRITNKWQRYSYQYTTTSKAMCIILRSWHPALIDAIQIEEGNKLTDFTAPPVEGMLKTSNKDNYIYLGQPINAHFDLMGSPKAKGEIKLDVFNYYRENVFSLTEQFELDNQGQKSIPLNLDPAKLGKGVFIVKTTFTIPQQETYFDYYRFAIIDPLDNSHASKNLFGTNMRSTRFTRSEDAVKRFMECGWGSCGSAVLPLDYYKKFNITQFYRALQKKYSMHWSKPPHPWYGIWHSWEYTTPEREKELEELVYQTAKKLPKMDHVETAVAGEINGRQRMVMDGKYDDYVKLMLAARRGAKRANKDIIFLPDQGTSGFKPLRGYRETEAILKSTAKVAPKGFKWDALAAHPYGDVDMIDERAEFFKKIAAKHGQEDVPLQFTECFNIAPYYLPSWGAGSWQDSYWNDRPTYDTGWSEFTQAAKAARIYIVSLKHWPRLEHTNIWISKPFIDNYLTPIMLCGAVNTLGHLFANPTFKADIRPVEGIRSYIFEDHEKRGLAAVWSTITEVDRGYEVAPKLKIKVTGNLPEIIDLMGNKRDYKVTNGEIIIPLSSAPIFVRTSSVPELTRAFNNAQVIGSNRAVKATILPVLNNQIDATITNQTSQALSGTFSVDKASQKFSLNPSPDKIVLVAKPADKTSFGKMYKWNKAVKIDLSNGGSTDEQANLHYFYVPKTNNPLPLDPNATAWSKIPKLDIADKFFSKRKDSKLNEQTGQKSDSSATYQMAWDNNNLYLKVIYKDDELMKPADKWLNYPKAKRNETLYMNDACLEVYIDTAADGRSNSRKWYDDDDYRYDFYGNGPEGIYRRQEVNQQLAGGVDFLNKKEAAKTIKHKFIISGNTASYVIIFPQVTIEPLALRKGFQAGFALFIHDADSNDRHGLSTSTEPGEHCNYRPDRWPIMVLGE